MTDFENANSGSSNEGRKPHVRLIQEKAYYHTNKKGQSVRKTKTQEVAVGWNEVSQKNNTPYVSFADGVISIEPDIEGKVKLFMYPIKE